MNSILHVGGAKCGSSSLQTALSTRPTFQSTDGAINYEYFCIGPPEWKRLQRKEIYLQNVRKSAHGYAPSCSALAFKSNEKYLQSLNEEFEQIIASSITPVLSSECWTGEASFFTEHNLLPALGLDARAILFVRPQISWLNSAWWQWGAWTGQTFDDWLHLTKPGPIWSNRIQEWQQVPGAASIDVYSATRDVIPTFYRALRAPVPEIEKSNGSLDAEILRFYQRNRKFRPDYLTPSNDFVLERCLPAGSRGTPWVIPHDKVAELIEYYRQGNEQLLSLVSEDERKIIENDPHWWDADAYRERQVEPAGAIAPTIEEVENLARRAIQAVLTLDEQNRTLKCEIDQIPVARNPLPIPHAGNLLPSTLRKAVSINGVRRLLGV